MPPKSSRQGLVKRVGKPSSKYDKRKIIKANINQKAKIKAKYAKIAPAKAPEYLEEAFKESEDTQPQKLDSEKSEVKIKEKEGRKKKPNPFAKLLAEQEKKQEEKKLEKQELENAKQEAKAAREDYYNKRKQQTNKLKQKTRKGQPLMKNQIDHLLNKIKSNPDTYQK